MNGHLEYALKQQLKKDSIVALGHRLDMGLRNYPALNPAPKQDLLERMWVMVNEFDNRALAFEAKHGKVPNKARRYYIAYANELHRLDRVEGRNRGF